MKRPFLFSVLRFLFAVLLVSSFLPSFGQYTFQKAIGNTDAEIGYAIKPYGNSGNFAFLASFSNSNNFQMGRYGILNDAGLVMWSGDVGSPASNDFYSDFSLVPDGSFMLASYTEEAGPGIINGHLTRVDTAGNIKWSNNYGITTLEEYTAISPSPDGTMICGGFSFQNSIDMFVSKIDTSGAVVWSKTVGSSTGGELSFDILATADNGALALGATSQGAGSDDLLFCKLSSTGTIQWTKIYGSGSLDGVRDAIELPGGGYIVTGITSITGTAETFLMKLSSTGNLDWLKVYTGGISESPQDIADHGANGYTIIGFGSGGLFGSSDGYAIQTDTSGNVVWSMAYGGTGTDDLRGGLAMADGGTFMIGSTQSFGLNGSDIYLVRVDSLGSSGCNDTVLSYTVVDTNFVSTTPAGIVATTGGALIAKTDSFSQPTLQVTPFCFTADCSAYQVMSSVNPDPACPGDTVALIDLTSGTISSNWKIDGNPVGSNLANDFWIADNGGTKTVTLISSDPYCTDSMNTSILVHPAPSFTSSPASSCPDSNIVLTNTTSGATASVWFVDGSQVGTGSPFTATIATSGNHDLALESTPNGCVTTVSFQVFQAPTSLFTYALTSSLNLDFIDGSSGTGLTYAWDFGDGSSSSLQAPSHTYASDSTFQVCLTVTNANGCSNVSCETLGSLIGLEEDLSATVSIYPNPAKDHIFIETGTMLNGEVSLSLFGLRGERIASEKRTISGESKLSYNLKNLANGIYFIELISGNKVWRGKIMVE